MDVHLSRKEAREIAIKWCANNGKKTTHAEIERLLTHRSRDGQTLAFFTSAKSPYVRNSRRDGLPSRSLVDSDGSFKRELAKVFENITAVREAIHVEMPTAEPRDIQAPGGL